MTMSDRIAVMRAGKIEQLGAPEELYERPATEFVAGFLGVSNLLDGRGRRAATARLADLRLADGTQVRAPAGALDGDDQGPRRRPAGEAAGAHAVRGESRSEADADANAIEGSVLDASYIGVSTQYLVETADGQRADRLRPEPGDERRGRGAGRRPARPPDVEAAAHVRHQPGRNRRRPPRVPDEGGATDRCVRTRPRSSVPSPAPSAPDGGSRDAASCADAGRGVVLAGSRADAAVDPRRVRHPPGRLGEHRAPAGGRARVGELARSTSTSTTTATTRRIVAFTEQTGIEVNYTEAIQDNADFFGTIRPDLQAGNPTGWDIITPGGWVIERMARLGFLEELDHSKLPNWTANARRLREGPLVRPRQQVQPVVAGRHHRHRLRPGADRARDHELRRPPRSRVRRAGRAASATCAT